MVKLKIMWNLFVCRMPLSLLEISSEFSHGLPDGEPQNKVDCQFGLQVADLSHYLNELVIDGVGSRILKEVQVPVITNDACKQFYQGTPAAIDDKSICAGFKEGGRDSCQGDSGGPLMAPHGQGDRFYLLGIVSFGIGCAQAQFPGVYTRVSAQMNWITSKLR